MTDPERPMTASDIMDSRQVAAWLNVPVSTVEHWARSKKIPSKKIGKRRIYIRSKIEALLNEEDPPT